MEETHIFTLESAWTGDSDGSGMLAMEDRYWEYGRPTQLGGEDGRSNPEEMLLGAVASCYSITLAGLAERKGLVLSRLLVRAEGDVVRQPDRSLKFSAIRLHPEITLEEDESAAAEADRLAHRAEAYCLVSNALRGNVHITVHPRVRGKAGASPA